MIDDNMIIKAMNGDEKSVEMVVEGLNPLIISSIRKYYFRPEKFEDLCQIGRIAVLDALNQYDETKGAHFLGFIKSKLKYLYLNMNREREFASLDMDIGDGLCMMDTLEAEMDVEAEYEIKETYSELYDAISKLTDRERQIILLFYFKELNLKQIAKLLGISYRTAVNNKTRAIKKLKQMVTIPPECYL